MSGSSDMRELLDRAADGPIGPAPIAELVGRGARRRRSWQATGIGLSAAVTAAVIIAVVGIVSESAPASHHRPRPYGTTAIGATAAQIAEGSWAEVPAPPIKPCGARSVTSNGNRVILVVSEGAPRCPSAAAAYDASTNRWAKLASPPAGLRGQLTSSDNIYVSRATGASAVLNPDTGSWRTLPVVPASGSLAVLVTGTSQPTLIGAGSQHDQTFSLAGDHWIQRPALPHPGSDIVALGAYSDGETQWAFVSGEQATRDGFKAGLVSFRLGATRWIRQPDLPNRPLAVRSVGTMTGEQIVIGSNCLPNLLCPSSGLQLGLANLDQGDLVDIPESPLHIALTAAVPAGNSVIGLDTDAAIESGGPTHPPIRPLASAVYDVASRRWLSGPVAAQVNKISGIAWTPAGLVVLGDPAMKCHCQLGGLILRPRTASSPQPTPTTPHTPAATRSVHPAYLPPGVRLASTRQLRTSPNVSSPPGFAPPVYAWYRLPGAVNRNTEHREGDPTRMHPSTNLTVIFNQNIHDLHEALPPLKPPVKSRFINIAGNRARVSVIEPDPRDIRVDWIDADGYHEVGCEGLTTAKGLTGLPVHSLIRIARSLYDAR